MKIIVATGASGGHVFPALSVAKHFQACGHEVLFVGAFRQWNSLIEDNGFSSKELPAKGWNTKSLKSALVSIGCMLKSFVIAFKINRAYKPECILGFGGYASFPVVLMGCLQGVLTAIHEQNVVPGRANKFLAKFVRKIFVSFEQSAPYFPAEKVQLSGYPLREFPQRLSKASCREGFGLAKDRVTIAVCGGSQGSRALNQGMVRTAELLQSQMDLQIIHIAGKDDQQIVEMAYERLGIAHKVFSFFQEIETVYQAADVIIARAGAGSIHEIAYFQVPAIIVPYPYAGDHQRHNARVLAERKLGVMIEEKDLTADRLYRETVDILNNASAYSIKEETKSLVCKEAADRMVKSLTERGHE